MSFLDRCQKVAILAFTIHTISGCAGTPPTNLGVTNGLFTPCPSSPNCTNSQATDDHKIDPIWFSGNPRDAKQKLLNVLRSNEQANIVENSGMYIRAEFKSSLMGFVDDVEFLISDTYIETRSASRLGYSDMGANKKRVEAIRASLAGCCDKQ